MGSTLWEIYTNAEDHEVTVLAEIDGVKSEQTWYYFTPTDRRGDYLRFGGSVEVAEQLLVADQAVFTIPTGTRNYVVGFSVSGLDRHIEALSDVCENGS